MTVKEEVEAGGLGPVVLAVMANRFDAVVREMTSTLLRAGRSGVLAMARDLSCSIVTGDNRLLTVAEGLPVHTFGSHLQTQAMCDLHSDLAEGDAYLHNDPYLGNTHPADHTVLVPVFIEGEHLFTAVAKAHQADCGNSLPTTYHASAKDIYEEGALIFPCVRVQRGYEEVGDVIRMCRRRIRVPDQWYGDYLATLGAARVAERRLKELAAKYGTDTIRSFVAEWFDYSERMMTEALRALPHGKLVGEGTHDPLPSLPQGIPIKVEVNVDAEKGEVEIDLRDNVDCVPAGLNESEACATNNVVAGVFNVLDSDVPTNAGSFRRIHVHLRENCVVGIPRHPASCSVATTNVADRLVNITQSAFADVAEDVGLAEGGGAMGLGGAVISGKDSRHDDASYVNQIILINNGGPATPVCDGWVTWGLPDNAGLLYRDSLEVDEQKYPIRFHSMELLTDTGGAGRFRGGLAGRIEYGPREEPMTVAYLLDGHQTPPRGVRGGQPGNAASATKLDESGQEVPLPSAGTEEVRPGERVVGIECGGGGYGPPTERDPECVLEDVLESRVSLEKAAEVYGVVFGGNAEEETLSVDHEATVEKRASLGERA